jgi:8-hydroxy-5-deazaflavin:NADPH oxidoreductase
MRIAVIGTGRVGTALGKGWAAAGHTVVFGSRRPAQVDCAVGSADSVAGAAHRSEVVVLAVPFGAAAEAVTAAGNLDGKVLVDATNPIGAAIPPPHRSGAERLAATVPGARVVKAFNTMGFEVMADPVVEGRPALLLYCGDDAGAKEVVDRLARDLGFDPVDAGSLSAARLLEGLAELWVHLALHHLGRGFTFALLRR